MHVCVFLSLPPPLFLSLFLSHSQSVFVYGAPLVSPVFLETHCFPCFSRVSPVFLPCFLKLDLPRPILDLCVWQRSGAGGVGKMIDVRMFKHTHTCVCERESV